MKRLKIEVSVKFGGYEKDIWDKVFNNRSSKICGKQHLNNFEAYGLLSRPYPFKFFKGCLL